MRRSERSKYLDTMMADMGITSLQELGSNEERNRWLKAVRPGPAVERKLREMGYDITGNSNKKSLGSTDRVCKIFSFFKKANTSTQIAELTKAMGDIRAVVNSEASYAILAIINEPKMMQSPDFDGNKLRRDLEAAIASHEDDPTSFQFYVQNLVDKVTKYNSGIQEELAARTSTGQTPLAAGSDDGAMRQYFQETSNIDIRRGHGQRDQIRFIQHRLESLGYTLNRLGANGVFDEQMEEAVVLFQHYNGIPSSGYIDDRMIDILLTNPTPMPTGTRREHRRLTRQEQRGSRQVAREDQRVAPTPAEPTAPGETPTFQNIEYTSSRVDIAGASPMLREYLKLLNQAAADIGGRIQITSAFRDSFNQARIMYNNYKSRGIGSSRANNYLKSLYRRFQKIDDIVAVFAGDQDKDTKIRNVESIIENNWLPKNGHRAGFSIDVRLGSKVKEILEASQDLATVDILRESDHFHVTVKSLEPGGIPRGKVRRFNA